MRKVWFIIILISFVLLRCGADDETELRVDIAEHPESGVYVTELTCIIVGCLYDKDDVTEIPAEFNWLWSETSSGVGMMMTTEHYTFTETQAQEVHCYFTAPSGYYFTGYWWMDISWTDEDGTPHYLETNKAHCTGTFKREFSIPLSRFNVHKIKTGSTPLCSFHISRLDPNLILTFPHIKYIIIS